MNVPLGNSVPGTPFNGLNLLSAAEVGDLLREISSLAAAVDPCG
jgi:hypothetical protein